MKAVVFATVLTISAVVCAAQTPAPGSRVRITADGIERSPVVGVLVPSAGDSLRIALVGDTIAIPAAAIRRFETANGTRRQVAKGLKIGAASGALLGAIAGAVSFKPCESTGFLSCYLEPETRTQSTLVGAGLGAVLGGVTGAIVGAIAVTDRWELVPSLSVR